MHASRNCEDVHPEIAALRRRRSPTRRASSGAARDREGGLRLRRRERGARVPQVGIGLKPEKEQQMTEKEIQVRQGGEDPDALREERRRRSRSASPATNILEDLKVNSARLVDVVLAFEDEFDIEIADEDVDTRRTRRRLRRADPAEAGVDGARRASRSRRSRRASTPLRVQRAVGRLLSPLWIPLTAR